jgi:hypothetical protein
MPPMGSRVLACLGRDLGRDGDGALGAAGGRVAGRVEDLGLVALSSMEAGRSGQRILPAVAGQPARW